LSADVWVVQRVDSLAVSLVDEKDEMLAVQWVDD
jgi:hypothetical protein